MIERIIVLFLDGVGLGDDEPTTNPLARAHLPTLQSLLDGHRLVRSNANLSTSQASLAAVDAQLGVPGLPQSGTGQTALLTGVNAPLLLGKHDGPYPNHQLHDLLDAGNLFKSVLAAGQSAAFANAYSDRFLDRIKRGTQRLSANTRAALSAGLKIRGPAELKQGRAVSSLLTNEYFTHRGYDVPEVSAAEAGAQLASLAQDHVLTYFEFWYTDLAGHRQVQRLSLHVAALLDEFIGGILGAVDMNHSLLVIISDHGNFEDLTTSKHTLNPALGLLAGNGHQSLARRCHSLADITPMLLSAIGE